jgi:hypothetical protein
MPYLLKDVRTLVDLTVRELARLRILNEELQHAEHWIRKHAARSLLELRTATVTNADMREVPARDLKPELAMTARVLCMTQVATPSCCAHRDNIVACLGAEDILETDERIGDSQLIAAGEGALLGRNPCGLFSMLFSQLDSDLLRILSVRALKVEMTITTIQNLDVSSPLRE